MATQKITDQQAIERTLRSYMLGESQQSPPFLVEIRVAPGAVWNGRTVQRGGLIIEGARPIGMITFCDTGDKFVTLTNSDSNYTSPIGQLRLRDIQSVQTLH